MNATREAWRPVPGYEGRYEVSDQGRVKSLEREVVRGFCTVMVGNRILRATKDGRGYRTVALCRDGVQKNFTVHSLVMLAFVGPLPKGQLVRHLNGSKTDNRLTNLAYGTYSENAHDKVAHGGHPNANLSHCKYGHKFSEENIKPNGPNGRGCRECSRRESRQRASRLKQAAQNRSPVRPNTPEERWLPVFGLEGVYSVSDQGRVRREARLIERRTGSYYAKQTILKPGWVGAYPKVVLIGRGTLYVHQLVAEAFIGPRPEGQVVRHLNDDPLDNWLENLEYGTHEQNMKDSVRNRGRAVALPAGDVK